MNYDELRVYFGGPCRHYIKESAPLKIYRSYSSDRVVWRYMNKMCGKNI